MLACYSTCTAVLTHMYRRDACAEVSAWSCLRGAQDAYIWGSGRGWQNGGRWCRHNHPGHFCWGVGHPVRSDQRSRQRLLARVGKKVISHVGIQMQDHRQGILVSATMCWARCSASCCGYLPALDARPTSGMVCLICLSTCGCPHVAQDWASFPQQMWPTCYPPMS